MRTRSCYNLLFALLAAITFFSVHAVPCDAATLTAAEYYFDADPGAGSGISLPAADGAYNSTEESIDVTGISTAGLKIGSHTLYLRFLSSDGVWGMARPVPFESNFASPTNFAITGTKTLKAAEYFIDQDPGIGMGVQVSAEDGAFDSEEESMVLSNISISGLTPGMRNLYLRAQDSEGTWGVKRVYPFEVYVPALIVNAEYFIDTDPGPGKGTQLLPKDGSFNSVLEEVEKDISSTGLTVGSHTLYVRFKDSLGRWGALASQAFSVGRPVAYATTTPVQPATGDGRLPVSVQFADVAAGSTCKMAVEYALEGTTTWTRATILPGSITATYGQPALDNGSFYQIGTSAGWIFANAGPNNISFVWSFAQDLGPVELTGVRLRFTASCGNDAQAISTESAGFALDSIPPAMPELVLYTPDPTGDTTPTLDWKWVESAMRYHLQVATDTAFTTLLFNQSDITNDAFTPTVPLPNGPVSWRVSAIDALGNEGYYSTVDTFSIVADSTSPSVTLSYNRPQPVGAGLLTITAVFSEPLIGAPRIAIDQPGTDDLMSSAMTGAGTTWSYTWQVNCADGGSNVDGTAIVTITGGFDAAGNQNTPAQNATFNINTNDCGTMKIIAAEYYFDVDPGEGSGIALPAADGAYDSSEESIDITGLSTEGLKIGSHTLYLRFLSSEGVWGLARPVLFENNFASPTNFTIIGTRTLAAAEYFIDQDPGAGLGEQVFATDGAFDSEEESLELNNISISNLDPGMHNLYLRAQDSEGTWGIVRVYPFEIYVPALIAGAEYFIDSDPGPGKGIALAAKDGSFNSRQEEVDLAGIGVASLSMGSHTVYVRFKDNLGRWGATNNATFNIVNDTGMPDTQITAHPPAITNNSSGSFTFTSDKADVTFECRIDSGNFEPCSSPASYALPDGVCTFSVHAIDILGNVDSTPASYTWTIDTTPPETNILTRPALLVASSSAVFTFTSSEAGSTFACSLDGADFSTCTSPKSYPGLADGLHNFLVKATDPAGNTDATSASYTWTIDTTPPETSIQVRPLTMSDSGAAIFTFTSSEAGSTFACRLDGGTFATCTSPKSYTGLADGLHTFSVKATDTAGSTDATPASFSWTIQAFSSSLVTNSASSFTMSLGASRDIVFTLKNSGTSQDAFDISVAGIPLDWYTLTPTNVTLGAGQSKSVVLSLSIPKDCSITLLDYIIRISAQSPVTGEVKSGEIALTLRLTNIPIISDLVPGNMEYLGSSTVQVSWKTDVEANSEIFYRQVGTEQYQHITGESGLTHRMLMENLTSGLAYEWYVVSRGLCGHTESDHRTINVQRGVIFAERETIINVDRSAQQIVPIRIVNQDSVDHWVSMYIDNSYKDLIVGFVGSGNAENPVLLPAGTTVNVNLAIHAQDALSSIYRLPMKLIADPETTHPIYDYAHAVVNVRQPTIPEYDFQLIELDRDQQTLTNRFRVTNTGSTINDLKITFEGCPGRQWSFSHLIEHMSLAKNESVDFSLTLFTDTCNSGCTGSVIAEGAMLRRTAQTEFGSGIGKSRYTVTLPDVHICRETTGEFPLTNAGVSTTFDIPAGIGFSDNTQATMQLNFILPNSLNQYTPYDLDVLFNKAIVKQWPNDNPSGQYFVTLPPSLINVGSNSVGYNLLQLLPSNINEGEYRLVVDPKLVIDHASLTQTVCATSQDEANQIVQSMPYLCNGLGPVCPKMGILNTQDEAGNEKANFNPGETVHIVVPVSNQGLEQQSADVTMNISGGSVPFQEIKTVSLMPGETTSLIFQWIMPADLAATTAYMAQVQVTTAGGCAEPANTVFYGVTIDGTPPPGNDLFKMVDVDRSGIRNGYFDIFFKDKFYLCNKSNQPQRFNVELYSILEDILDAVFDNSPILQPNSCTLIAYDQTPIRLSANSVDKYYCAKISLFGESRLLCDVNEKIEILSNNAIIASKKLSDTRTTYFDSLTSQDSEDINNNFYNESEGKDLFRSGDSKVSTGNVLTHRIVDFDGLAGDGVSQALDNSNYAIHGSKGDNGRIPILLIHGWQGDKSLIEPATLSLWKNSEIAYSQHFIDFYLNSSRLQSKYHLYLYNYPTYKHIKYNAKILKELLDEVTQQKPLSDLAMGIANSDKGVAIVAHSMGGLVSRSLVEENGFSVNSLRKLITLDTPQHGTPLSLNYSPLNIAKDLSTQGAVDLNWDSFDSKISFKFYDNQPSVGPNENNNDNRWSVNSINSQKFDSYYWNLLIQEGKQKDTFNPWLLHLNENFSNFTNVLKDKYVLYSAWSVSGATIQCKFGLFDDVLRWLKLRIDNNQDVNYDFIDNGCMDISSSSLAVYGYSAGGAEPVTSALLSSTADNACFYPIAGTLPNYTQCYDKPGIRTQAPPAIPLIILSDGADHPLGIPYRIFWDYDHEKMLNGAYACDDKGCWDSYIDKTDVVDSDSKTAFIAGSRLAYINAAREIRGFGKYPSDTVTSSLNPLNDPIYIILEMDLMERAALKVDTAGQGFGTVQSTNPQHTITCSSMSSHAYRIGCDNDYDNGTLIQLTATADSGSEFIGWSGACTGTAPCSIVMDGNKQVTATFRSLTPPDTTLTDVPRQCENGPSVFSFQSTKPEGTFQCKLDNHDTYPCSSPQTLTQLVDGLHTFAVAAIDGDGNIDPTPVSYGWKVDTTPPIVSADKAGGLYSSPPTVTLAANEPATIYYTMDGTTPTASSSVYAQPIAVPAAGATISFFAIDFCGNSSGMKSETYVIDSIKPELRLSTLPTGSTTNNSILNIAGIVTDNYGIKSLRINDVPVTVYSMGIFSHAIQLKPRGINFVTVVAEDNAGNITSETRMLQLILTLPALTISQPADNSVTNSANVVVAGTSEAGTSVEYTLNDDVSQGVVQNGSSFSASVALVTGMNTLVVKNQSADGRTNSVKRTIFYDPAGPSLSIEMPNQDSANSQDSILIRGNLSGSQDPLIMTVNGTSSSPVLLNGAFEQTVVMPAEGYYAITVSLNSAQTGSTVITQRNIIRKPLLTIDPVISPTNKNSQTVTGTIEPGYPLVISCPTASIGAISKPTPGTWSVPVTGLSVGSNTITATAMGPTSDVVTATAQIVYVPGSPSPGDCNNDGKTTIDEVQSAIKMFFYLKTVTSCVDLNGDRKVREMEMEVVINGFLGL